MIATLVLLLSSVSVQLPVVESDDLRFVHLTSLQGMAATHVRQIVQAILHGKAGDVFEMIGENLSK